MFPAKNALLAAGLVLILMVFVHRTVTTSLSNTAAENATALVNRAAGLMQTRSRLQALEMTNETAGYARQEAFSKIFALGDETARRTAAYDAANAINEQQLAKAHGRRAALVAVVDAAGKVVARDLNINALYGEDFKGRYPAVAAALSGTANKDVWAFSGRMYRVTCAPIRSTDGRIVGALVVGFEESGNDAWDLRSSFGTDVVVYLDGKIYASSFASEGKESIEEQALAKVLFAGPQLAAPTVTAQDRRQTDPFRVTLQEKNYVGVAGPLLSNTSHPLAGFVVLASLEQAQQASNRAGMWILGFGFLAALITLATGILTARRFLLPLDRIEEGITEIINGNHEYVFEKQGNIDFEGLENGLNVMVARLLGRPEPSETSEGMSAMDVSTSGRVVAVDSRVSGPTPGPGGARPSASSDPLLRLSPENQELAREPQEQYQRRLFNEYIHAREQTGEGARDLTYESFIEKLKDNEATLCKKYNSRAVRFKVVIKQGQVTLKPVPIP